ncbi:5-methylcytosine rRNA methyltransferase l(2)10685 [Dermatophagoides pteronyssinus]|uniref:5-methylcytosine rRNA methyltransferase l(2)10685 n=1 Tax=Dermatophagoides pteronyssinus TaxID=6956 RepID=UPI003F66418F
MFVSNYRKIKSLSLILKNNVHFYKGKNKINNTELALRHFDNFYGKIYEKQWQSIRLGLLSPKKYAAIVNNFVDFESTEIELRQIGAYNLRYIYDKNLRKIIKQLKREEFIQSRKLMVKNNNNDDHDESIIIPSELEQTESETENIEAFFTDVQESELEHNQASLHLDLSQFVPVTELKYREEIVDDREYFEFYNTNHELVVDHIEQTNIEMPILLNLYLFRRNDFTQFPAAKLCQTNLFNYYLLDGASILPVLAMDIQNGDYVADFCAAPGGKSLLMYLQMKNCKFFLNELSESRFERLKNVFRSFIPKDKIKQSIIFSHSDAIHLRQYNKFDKILVDVPCTNDRHSIYSNENNIFSPKRMNERISIPNKQLDLLCEALKSIKINGTVVYSTCSLSPIQNDGVIHMALKRMNEEQPLMKFAIINLKQSLRPLRTMFQFDFQFKYGIQILPNICTNFGPMYFCKIQRLA